MRLPASAHAVLEHAECTPSEATPPDHGGVVRDDNGEAWAEFHLLGVEDAVMELEGMSPSFAVKLGKEDIKTVEDVAGLVPDDLTGWRESGPEGKPVWQDGILKKGEMRKDEAQLFIMRARVLVGWIEAEALVELEASLAAEAEGEQLDLTEEERALLAIGELGKSDDAGVEDIGDIDLSDEELMMELEELGSEDILSTESGDDAADEQ